RAPPRTRNGPLRPRAPPGPLSRALSTTRLRLTSRWPPSPGPARRYPDTATLPCRRMAPPHGGPFIRTTRLSGLHARLSGLHAALRTGPPVARYSSTLHFENRRPGARFHEPVAVRWSELLGVYGISERQTLFS